MAKHWKCTAPWPGQWVKGKMVGSGSFGSVHLAMNKSTGALFVVKSARSEVGLECLKNEAEILEDLNSPHVVQCSESDLKNGKKGEREFNLFIEYMAGGSLSDVAENFGGVLDEGVIRLYTKEILLGLNYLHRNGIVHCDLKCKNVLLGLSGNVKLADFGCARKINSNSKRIGQSKKSSISIVGSPLWMAPEILRNEELDFAADIWSLGCTVIEMATGRPPWGDEVVNPMAAVLKIAWGDEIPCFPAQFSKEGFDFLEKCLERNPKKRWKSEDLLNHPFVLGGKEEGTCSPASVLGVGKCEEGYESDDSLDGSDLKRRIVFCQTRSCQERKGNLSWEHEEESDFSSSDIWITVRSI